jgi:4-hydroxy-tetrahydrodipicolinate synthase
MNSGCYTAMVTPFDGAASMKRGFPAWPIFRFKTALPAFWPWAPPAKAPPWPGKNTTGWFRSSHNRPRANACASPGQAATTPKRPCPPTRHAAEAGVDAVLLVDPYYNGPSSLEIRKNTCAGGHGLSRFTIIPYVIPGRTGAQLLPEDLALLFKDHPNVNTVKEATGNLDNMRRTRRCCGPEFTIFSGDDGLVEMMADPDIAATGVISVVSNIAPKAMSDLVRLLASKETEAAKRLADALRPLFGLVTVQDHGAVTRRRSGVSGTKSAGTENANAAAGRTIGTLPPPLGKMSRGGLDVVVNIAKTVQSKNPEILAPLAAFFNVDIDARLNDERLLEGLYYPTY